MKGNANPFVGTQPVTTAKIDECLQGNHEGDAKGHKAPEIVAGVKGNPQAEKKERQIHGQHREAPRAPTLLQ